MNSNDVYRPIAKASIDNAQFCALVSMLVHAALDNLAGEAPDVTDDAVFRRGGVETLAHQIACLCAQRFGMGVALHDVVEALDLYAVRTTADRRRLVEAFVDELEQSRLSAALTE